MKRKYTSFPVADAQELKAKMLSWVNRFNICCFLDNHHYQLAHHSTECLAAAGVIKLFKPTSDLFQSLDLFIANNDDWIFGHFNYDCKNYVEALSSNNFDGIGFPDCFLFVPEVVLELKNNQLSIGVINDDAEGIFNQIIHLDVPPQSLPQIKFSSRITEATYISTVEKLQQHILHGDCYEVNFCQEFYATAVQLQMEEVYKRLVSNSPNPYAAYYRINDHFLACASPERYIKKTGSQLISQPIKGTIARNHRSAQKDEGNKLALLNSEKERAENVMIVDLVRNDLSKICKEGSVKVEELMAVQTFPNVHQMVSTVAGELAENVSLGSIIKASFPMGSMTGAPKKSVMELIEKYESTKRGIFSGTVGYISPAKDFDFNVVIRSLMYNSSKEYLSYQVGSAITYSSNPPQEYEECMLKAEAIRKVFV